MDQDFLQDIEYDLKERLEVECKYVISSTHRKGGNPHKSIWSLSNRGEIECFINSFSSNWIDENVVWGLVFDGLSLQTVGHNINNEDLKLAKFIDARKNSLFHGYPADYLRRAHDRPSTNTLRDWVNKGYITKAKMSKIRLGQLCNL